MHTGLDNATDIPRTEACDIGPRIRQLRYERNWTLAQVSERTGLSLSAISKIERGELSPTLASLNKLAKGFEIDIVTLISMTGASTPSSGRRTITRAGEGLHHLTATCDNTWLASEIRNKRMLPIHTHVMARDPAEYSEWQTHNGELFVMVLEGTLVIHSELYEVVTLEKGDSIYYDGKMGVKWTSAGMHPAEVIWVYA
ncbi:helix-turn-helix domain-containing protein [Komagataeibacter swingsii]|uniref:XRE family transcriptional regulator n=1 Tax=Komagataeibacter swingsii TaxID=215220 RepID=A0A2V4R0B4_9PROT|nr:XRE family transcriptional regulator [Komagataeibacter swingsii]PYD68193.1 XRE family transcriptional regulator [Komagataeibacter swingsii]GBQ57530.1 DNA-binding protein [Komagataeibacter swingsii DSM 16373]